MRQRFWAVLVLLLGLSACAAPQQRATVTNLDRQQGSVRMVVMPLDVELAEMAASGILVPKADWTEAAHRNLGTAMLAEEARRGLRLTNFDIDRAGPERREVLTELQRLHGAVGRAIRAHHSSIGALQLPTKAGRLEWTLGPEVRRLAEATEADYALFIQIRDSYTSPERAALIIAAAILRVPLPGGSQQGYASLVDLRTGDVVWFNSLARGNGDLRTPEGAAETAGVLFQDLPQ
jgi:hypothetical protein